MRKRFCVCTADDVAVTPCGGARRKSPARPHWPKFVAEQTPLSFRNILLFLRLAREDGGRISWRCVGLASPVSCSVFASHLSRIAGPGRKRPHRLVDDTSMPARPRYDRFSDTVEGKFRVRGATLGLAVDRRLFNLGWGVSFDADLQATHNFGKTDYSTVAFGLGVRFHNVIWEVPAWRSIPARPTRSLRRCCSTATRKGNIA